MTSVIEIVSRHYIEVRKKYEEKKNIKKSQELICPAYYVAILQFLNPK